MQKEKQQQAKKPEERVYKLSSALKRNLQRRKAAKKLKKEDSHNE
ncbi:MAG: hypothetical protein Tsb006_6590 [Rickettsiaceae bacterium]